MENDSQKWKFQGNEALTTASAVTVRGVLNELMSKLNPDDPRTVVPLGHGDPSHFPSFRTTPAAEDAVVDALRSGKFNCYSSTSGIPSARRAIADYLSKDLPYSLSPDDVFITLGCTQAIELILTVLARPGANVLVPRPGFPYYESRAAYLNLELRHFDLLPDTGWEVDLKMVEDLANENTVAIVVIDPGNPCGNVFSYNHLKEIAETAKKLGIMVIADEVYDHLVFGSNPFVPMGVFGSMVPVVTLGSISKRWIVPGWRLGWLVTSDPNGILRKTGIVDSIIGYRNVSTDPVTFVQAALPDLMEKTNDEFFSKIISVLKLSAEICFERIKEIPCITCPSKPQGSMFVMVKLNVSMLDGITDDIDFCMKLSEEESVIVLPGTAVGLKNWLRVTFSIEPSFLEEGIGRIKTFYQKHAKKIDKINKSCVDGVAKIKICFKSQSSFRFRFTMMQISLYCMNKWLAPKRLRKEKQRSSTSLLDLNLHYSFCFEWVICYKIKGYCLEQRTSTPCWISVYISNVVINDH